MNRIILTTLMFSLVLVAGCGTKQADTTTVDQPATVVDDTTDTQDWSTVYVASTCDTVSPAFLSGLEFVIDDADIEVLDFADSVVGSNLKTLKCEYKWDQTGLKFNQGRMTIAYFTPSSNAGVDVDAAYTQLMDEATLWDTSASVKSVDGLGSKAEWIMNSDSLVFKTNTQAVYIQFKRGNKQQENLAFVTEVAKEIINNLK